MMATYDNIHTIPADEKVLIAIRFMLDVQEYHLELLHVFAEKLVQVFAGDLKVVVATASQSLTGGRKPLSSVEE